MQDEKDAMVTSLTLCLERYMPTALCQLAGSYLAKRPQFIPAPQDEWLSVTDLSRTVVLKVGVSQRPSIQCVDTGGLVTHPETAGLFEHPEWCVSNGRSLFAPVQNGRNAHDGHSRTSWSPGAIDITFEPRGFPVLRVEGVRVGPTNDPSGPEFAWSAHPQVLYDFAAHEVFWTDSRFEPRKGTIRIHLHCHCPTTLLFKRSLTTELTLNSLTKDVVGQVWGPSLHACSGWIVCAVWRGFSQTPPRCRTGWVGLYVLKPNTTEWESIQNVQCAWNPGSFVSVDDETVVWAVPTTGGSYQSGDRCTGGVCRSLPVNSTTSEMEIANWSRQVSAPISMTFRVRVMRLNIAPVGDPTNLSVDDDGDVAVPIADQPHLYRWSQIVPIICPQTQRVVGIAADLRTYPDNSRKLIVPLR
jgi:hypothetical protein